MKIKFKDGKHGKNDKIILFTSTNRNNTIAENEAVTIYKLGELLNQLAVNELKKRDGYVKMMIKSGKWRFRFKDAMIEAISMAWNDVNWAETHNWELVKEWAKRHRLNPENVESELKRTFQKGLDEYE